MENGLTASDVALMQKDSGYGWDSSFMWIFALLILLFGGNGFGLGGGGLPGAAGNIEIVMTKDGVQQSQSMISIPTVVATEGIHGSITTLVQATKNNGTCCCSSPTTIQFVNTGVELTQATINVVVTKLC